MHRYTEVHCRAYILAGSMLIYTMLEIAYSPFKGALYQLDYS